ncbi:MAG TPA: hypothetical protein VI911_10350 [Patescibacteria group bacterium]|nr:hypothetical protein [Patescibacteria group bacterium]
MSANSNLRTNEVLGKFSEVPRVDARFEMIAESLTGVGVRCVSTSPVVSVTPVLAKDIVIGYQFNTQNTIYYLELMAD